MNKREEMREGRREVVGCLYSVGTWIVVLAFTGHQATRNGLGMRLSFSVFELNTIMGLIVRLHMGLTSMMQAREGTRMVQR